MTIYKVDMTDCAWPNGYERSYNPFDLSHSCGSNFNNRGWEASAGTSGCLMAWGPYLQGLTAGQTFRVFYTFLARESRERVACFIC